MKRLAFLAVIALLLSVSIVNCSKKGGEEYDELYDTTNIAGAVKYIDTLPPGSPLFHGGLNVTGDFDRIKLAIAAKDVTILAGYNKLIANKHADSTYGLNGPVDTLIRGGNSREEPKPDNYSKAFNDAAAAYQLAIRWKIDGKTGYANKAIQILNAWAATCKQLSGDPNVFLAAGFYGYQFALAGELMRDYNGWKPEDFQAYKQWMLTVFYQKNHSFLTNHNDACIDHYWANWDLGNIASVMAIGILTDNRSMYNEAVNYLQRGAGNGNLRKAIYYVHKDEGLAQLQESGRDQGHATLVMAMLGTICEMAWNQGDDFYGFNDNAVLKAAEYTAKYNVANEEVPFKTYNYPDCDTTIVQSVISDDERGTVRPFYAMIYNHYVKRKGLRAPYTERGVNSCYPEGGGGDYGPNSGGFDQLGFGTLLYTRP
ncbi:MULTISPECIES: alginate lyase family protein [Niastella]|uniref:Alginate lyase family protein n=1 Tax=Niastella soli TaxID=2821487 RepID=A0ABS3YRN6_9BACT|nr:alginate lyase family protein [Niastella soli]MBO9200543.1 alginate lyase family protein [Niastella soli]